MFFRKHVFQKTCFQEISIWFGKPYAYFQLSNQAYGLENHMLIVTFQNKGPFQIFKISIWFAKPYAYFQNLKIIQYHFGNAEKAD